MHAYPLPPAPHVHPRSPGRGVGVLLLLGVTACEFVAKQECFESKEDSLVVDPLYWKLEPSRAQQQTFVVSGKRDGEALESLSVDIEVQPNMKSVALGSAGSPADFVALTPATAAYCDQLSSQLLRCLLDQDGTTSFVVDANPLQEFPPFTITVEPTCGDKPSPIPAIAVDSDWRDFHLAFVTYPELLVVTAALRCDGEKDGCDTIRRVRPVELRLYDNAGAPVELPEYGALAWTLYVNSIHGTGKAKLYEDVGCTDPSATSNSSIKLEAVPAGSLAISRPYYVCADGHAASVELGAKATLSITDHGSEQKPVDIVAPPENVAFDGYLARAAQYGTVDLNGPDDVEDPNTLGFQVRLTSCDGKPMSGEDVSFTSTELVFPTDINPSWTTDEAGLVSVRGQFKPMTMQPTSYPVEIRTDDDRDCDLDIAVP